MKLFATLRAAVLLATTAALSVALAASGKDELEAKMARDGLQKTNVKNIDLAYVRPGATLAAYKRVKLDPVEVEFSPSWNPNRTGSSLKLSTQEKEAIRSGVAKLVEEEFAREIQSGGRYQVVTETGAGRAARPARHRQPLHQRARHRRGALAHHRLLGRRDDADRRAARFGERPGAGARGRPARGDEHPACSSPTAWSTSPRRAGSPPAGRRPCARRWTTPRR